MILLWHDIARYAVSLSRITTCEKTLNKSLHLYNYVILYIRCVPGRSVAMADRQHGVDWSRGLHIKHARYSSVCLAVSQVGPWPWRTAWCGLEPWTPAWRAGGPGWTAPPSPTSTGTRVGRRHLSLKAPSATGTLISSFVAGGTPRCQQYYIIYY